MNLGGSDFLKRTRSSIFSCCQGGGTLEVQLLAFSSPLCSSRRGVCPDSQNIHLHLRKQRMPLIDIRKEDAGVTGYFSSGEGPQL